MYDYVKLAVTDKKFAEALLNNPDLDFISALNTRTGELESKYQADYKGLRFNLFPSCRVEIKGSLHKYWNDGKHNFNDFALVDVQKTIKNLEDNFSLDPELTRVENLEFGINIHTAINPNLFLSSLVAFKNRSFNSMRIKGPGKGKDVYLTQYGIKIYNKGLQYGVSKDILRFERKVFKMENIRKQAIYLADLTKKDFSLLCLETLLETFDMLIIKEKVNEKLMTRREIKIFERCTNPLNWEIMSRKQRNLDKNKFASIIDKYGTEKLKATISQMLVEKGKILLNITPEQNVPDWTATKSASNHLSFESTNTLASKLSL